MTPERRTTRDRRRRPTPPISRYLFRGRRKARRRDDDPSYYYADRLGATTWLVILSIFLFQVVDAYMTLSHLRNGAVELNPFMDYLLDQSNDLFLFVKLSVSAVGLLFLGIHRNFPMVRSGLAVIFLLFLGVVGWHCLLALRVG